MPPPLIPQAVWGVTGGLITQSPSATLDPTATDNLSDVVFDNSGALSPRPGFAIPAGYPALANSAYHVSQYTNFSGVTRTMSASLNLGTGAVKVFFNNAGVWTDLTGALVLAGVEDTCPTSVNFHGRWFFANGTQDFIYWNGVAGSAATVKSLQANPLLQPPTFPKVVISETSGAHILLLNYTDASGNPAPQGVSWSGFLDESSWNGGVGSGGAGSQLLADDNLPITAGTTFGPFVVVFKARSTYISIWNENGPPFFKFIKREEDRGCVAQGSIAAYNNTRIWLGDDNVYLFDGEKTDAVASRVLSRIIQRTNPDYMNRAFAVVDRYNGRYHLFMPIGGDTSPPTMRKLFTFSFASGGWTESEISATLPVVCALSVRTGNWAEKYIFGDRNGNFLDFTSDAHSDNGANFTPFWETKILDAIALTQSQREVMDIEAFSVHATSGKFRAQVAYSDYFESLSNNFEDLGLVSLNGADRISLPARGPSRFAKLRIEWPDLADAPAVQGYTAWARLRTGRSDR